MESHPKRILDLCCGTGDLAIRISIAANEPLEITCFDLNPSMLDVARQKALQKKITTIEFIEGDAGSMPFRMLSLIP